MTRWVQVLTGFRGRLRRRDFWIGVILLLLAEIVLSFLFVGIMRPTGATELELAAMWLALAILVWVSAALIVKRLHDRDKSALWYPLFGLAPAVAYELGNRLSSNISNELSPVQIGFWLLSLVLWLWAIVELGFLRGTKGPNRYGPDPLGQPKSSSLGLWRAISAQAGRIRTVLRQGAPHIPSSASLPFGLTRGGARAKPGRKGRGNDGLQYLYTSFDGRINRAKYWAGIVILAIVSIVLGFVIGAVFGPTTLGAILVTLVTLALFYPGYAVAAKRFQDRDKPGVTALYGLVPVLIASLLQAFGLTGTPSEPNAIGWICNLVTMGVGLWFLIELGILKGTPGPNRFGGDPLAAVR